MINPAEGIALKRIICLDQRMAAELKIIIKPFWFRLLKMHTIQ